MLHVPTITFVSTFPTYVHVDQQLSLFSHLN